jgi:hypothetical protein
VTVPTSTGVTSSSPSPTPAPYSQPSSVAATSSGANVEFPIGWLLEHAALPIQYRAIVDVARLPAPVDGRVSWMPYAHRPALLLATLQGLDGSWNRSMLTLPGARAERFEGVGTIHAVRRLLEYGWDRESPPLLHSRRLLFRLLAEDDDPNFLFEFAPKGKAVDPEGARRARGILREAAAAALAQAGYEGDPRLRGAARRILERVNAYLRSPLAQKPFVRSGNQHVLAPEAAPPSIHTLTMLAYMPLFRSEQYESLDRIYQYICQPMPRQEPVQTVGGRTVGVPHLVLGDMLPHRNAADADVPWALTWLELMARLNFLRRNENWRRLFERFLDDRDASGVWHPHKGMAAARSNNPLVWASYPLESNLSGDERWTDATFRLGLIARCSGRQIELV